MIAIPLSELFTDWIALIHSFWFSFESPLNFLKQKSGFCKICLQEWFICAHCFRLFTSKFQKTFSARCWRPGLLMIFSMLNAKLCSSVWESFSECNYLFSEYDYLEPHAFVVLKTTCMAALTHVTLKASLIVKEYCTICQYINGGFSSKSEFQYRN